MSSCNSRRRVVVASRGPWLNGSVSGHVRERPDSCVLWVDAHADVNVPLTTPTGNLHGQPVAFLLRKLHDKRSAGAHPPTSPRPTVWARTSPTLGSGTWTLLRGDPLSATFILKSGGMRHFSMRDVDLLVIQKVVEMALDHLMPRCRRPLHLSFDMDALDPSVAPAATGTPVRGGGSRTGRGVHRRGGARHGLAECPRPGGGEPARDRRRGGRRGGGHGGPGSRGGALLPGPRARVGGPTPPRTPCRSRRGPPTRRKRSVGTR
ncbi:unnamed protein product [Lampetra fluviatilis]